MTKQAASKLETILAHQVAHHAGRCPICTRPVGAPYRRQAAGVTVEGCISLHHPKDAWNSRPEAQKWQADQAARLLSGAY